MPLANVQHPTMAGSMPRVLKVKKETPGEHEEGPPSCQERGPWGEAPAKSAEA